MLCITVKNDLKQTEHVRRGGDGVLSFKVAAVGSACLMSELILMLKFSDRGVMIERPLFNHGRRAARRRKLKNEG